jgi:hypothetical protein
VLQVHGRLQTITAVVASTAGNPDAPGVRRKGQCQLCYGQSGALHQGVRWQGGLSGVLNAADGLNAVQSVA